jgi:hypothetical protein
MPEKYQQDNSAESLMHDRGATIQTPTQVFTGAKWDAPYCLEHMAL